MAGNDVSLHYDAAATARARVLFPINEFHDGHD
jgi:hypothetical protein